MESNNDYRQLCKMPRSNDWHAAKHISTRFTFLLAHFFTTFSFCRALFRFWPLLCSCGRRKNCEPHKTMQTLGFWILDSECCIRNKRKKKSDWILYSIICVCIGFQLHALNWEHSGIENVIQWPEIFVCLRIFAMHFDCGVNAEVIVSIKVNM